jgi:adenylate cyclase
MPNEASSDQIWRMILQDGYPPMRWMQRVMSRLPGEPRCKMCYLPFTGVGGTVGRLLGRAPSNYNPRLCNTCEDMCKKYPGGTELELTFMFADVRGSTSIAERMSPLAFSQLMDRFYTAAAEAMIKTDGLIEKFVGDNVTALFPPGISGREHARKAIDSARLLLLATGHGAASDPWLPVGVGVHTGVAFVGAVGSGGVTQLTSLGDAVNAAARLASNAAAGEILISDEACRSARQNTEDCEHRELQLKGRSEAMGAYVLRLTA